MREAFAIIVKIILGQRKKKKKDKGRRSGKISEIRQHGIDIQEVASLDPLPVLPGRVNDKPAVVGVVPATWTGLQFPHLPALWDADHCSSYSWFF